VIIVETPNALPVADRDHLQDVKKLAQRLKLVYAKTCELHITTLHQRQLYPTGRGAGVQESAPGEGAQPRRYYFPELTMVFALRAAAFSRCADLAGDSPEATIFGKRESLRLGDPDFGILTYRDFLAPSMEHIPIAPYLRAGRLNFNRPERARGQL
jgi:hypothetical protein